MKTPDLDTRPRKRGSAMLVVLIAIVCMVLFLDAASHTLHTVDRQLDHLNARQQKKFSPSSAPTPAAIPSSNTQK